jgi:hypothetical protein
MLLLLNRWWRDFRWKHRLRQQSINQVGRLIVSALCFNFSEYFPWRHNHFIDLSEQIVLAMTVHHILEARLTLR